MNLFRCGRIPIIKHLIWVLNDSINNLKHLPFVDGAVSYSITVESKQSSNQIKSNKKVAEFKLVSK